MTRLFTVGLASLLLAAGNCHAILFYSTGSTGFNTTAPTGPLENSGWQFQGNWGSVSGIPIAPNYFITAKHINGNASTDFVFGGTTYDVIGSAYNDPAEGSDLQIWQVSGTFSTYAPLFTGTNEAGKSLVMFGRGTQRGAEVFLSGTSKGWEWGAGDEVRRWGENEVEGIYDGGVAYGHNLLGMTFSGTEGVNEGTYSTGDSGGGVFIFDGGVWKLAGINSWADGPYGLTNVPFQNSFLASIYNQDGYYADTLTGWQPVSGPGMIYATRISSSQNWILSVIPEPSTWWLCLVAALCSVAFRRGYRREALARIGGGVSRVQNS